MTNPVKKRRLGLRPTTIQVIFDQSPMKLPKWSGPMKSTARMGKPRRRESMSLSNLPEY
jgi:hypothetical protein